MSRGKFLSWGFLVIIFVSFIFFSNLVSFVTDWWWFQEVGFTDIFIKSFGIKAIVGIGVGLIALVFLLTNFFIAAHSKIPWMTHVPSSVFGTPLSIDQRFIRRIGIILCIFLSFFIALVASSFWQDILKFLASTPFNQKDPLFGKDISFYVFELPVYSFFLSLAKTMVVISFIGCSVIYILRYKFNITKIVSRLTGGNILQKNGHARTKNSEYETDPRARLHISILGFLFFAALAGGTYLSIFSLLSSSNGPVFGATFTDANVMAPILRISAVAYGLAAFFALVYGISGRIAPLIVTFGLTILIGIVSIFVPALIQKLIVAPNELVKETPYIKYNIAATRQAYNLNKVEKREIVVDKPLTVSDIAANNLTIKNVRLWDRDPLLSTFSQIQEIRTYYEFVSVDNDRYVINNELRQVMLSPRELASESLPNKNWINQHLTFTHGYGVAAGPVNQVTPEGLPVLFVKDLPPKANVKELEISRPEIYYGEITNDYAFVKSGSKEFDYPKGEENVYSTYGGKGGVQIDSPIKKLFYSIYFGSLKLLLSGDINSETRVMYARNVIERVEKIAPFLTFDSDPYLVIADGKLYWILDAYTFSDSYPYAQEQLFGNQNVNYVRNSVKAVVDAYNGTVTFYQVDPDDPIIKTYVKIFPNTFRPLSDMPKSLIPHLRYPEDIFALQTAIYSTYHMDDPQIFYNKEDLWEIPSIPQEGAVQTGENLVMAPRHMIMKLPDEEKEEYIFMLPFTPRGKDNLSAWMVARNDGEEYGKLVVYNFPKDKLVYGPKQVIGRINQDPEVSKQISLWDQRGSQVIQGPLLVIPIEKSLVYVRPLYLKAESGKIPELKRVIVAYENKIAMEETLERGLGRIFAATDDQISTQMQQDSQTTTTITSTDMSNVNLFQQANDAYESALAAQREGDWAKYGEQIKKLGEILQRLQQ